MLGDVRCRRPAEADGRAAEVGRDREMEHATGLNLIHTLWLGHFIRLTAGPEPCLSFNSACDSANASIAVPFIVENDTGRRSHDLTVKFSNSDVPRFDELVVVPGTAMPGRPHDRVGNRIQILKDLDHDVDNPAAV